MRVNKHSEVRQKLKIWAMTHHVNPVPVKRGSENLVLKESK